MYEAVRILGLGWLACGLACALYLVLAGFRRSGSPARGSSIGFRLLIIPSVVLLWPLGLRLVFTGGKRT